MYLEGGDSELNALGLWNLDEVHTVVIAVIVIGIVGGCECPSGADEVLSTCLTCQRERKRGLICEENVKGKCTT